MELKEFLDLIEFESNTNYIKLVKTINRPINETIWSEIPRLQFLDQNFYNEIFTEDDIIENIRFTDNGDLVIDLI